MKRLDFGTVKVGDTLPPLELPSLNRTTLALFCGASNDHNPAHIDIDAARKLGMTDVFGHGMLSMAWLGRLLTQWVEQRQVRSFGVRFGGLTHLGHRITCTGKVVEKLEVDGEQRVKLEVRTTNQYGEVKIVGDAVVAL